MKEKRAEYGEEILQTLSAKLTLEFGQGFSQRNLASMVQFAEAFTAAQTTATHLLEATLHQILAA